METRRGQIQSIISHLETRGFPVRGVRLLNIERLSIAERMSIYCNMTDIVRYLRNDPSLADEPAWLMPDSSRNGCSRTCLFKRCLCGGGACSRNCPAFTVSGRCFFMFPEASALDG